MKYLITNPDSFGDILLRQPLFTGLIEEGHDVGVVVRKSYSSIIRYLDPRIRIFPVEDVNPYVPSILEHRDSILRSLDDAAVYDPDILVIAPFQRTLIDIWTVEKFAGKKTIGIKGIEVVYEQGERVFRETQNPGDRALFVPEDLREFEKNRRLLGLCLGREVERYLPKLSLDETSLELARRVHTQMSLIEGEYIVCTPGSASIALKQYPADRYVDILNYWADKYDRDVLLVGNRAERSVLESIKSGLIERNRHAGIWIGDEMNLEVLLGLISMSMIYFGNDTGPMHFAAALGKPVLAAFGGGHWPRFIPLAERGAVLAQELPCYGCGWRCVFDKAHCIHGVSESWVKEAIDEIETNKAKKFTIRSHDFKGDAMDHWIAEANEQLKNNKLKIDSMSHELEKAREVAGNREQASVEARVELEAMRTEYLNLKKREEEALTQVAAFRAEAAELRKSNVLIAESLKKEQEGRQAIEAQVVREREANTLQSQKIVALERTLESTKEVVMAREESMAAGQKRIGELESLVGAGKHTIARLGEDLSKERMIATQHRTTIEQQELALVKARIVGGEMRRVLTEFKPRLEDFHLSIRLQDVTLQTFERRLQEVAQSGWTKLGLTLRIPFLTKWYAEAFDGTQTGLVPIVRKDEFEVPLSVKELMRTELNRIISILETYPV